MTSATTISAPAAVESVRAGVDDLLAADLSSLSGLEVVELLDALEQQTRRLAAVDARVLAEVSERGTAGELGRTSVDDLLTVRLRVSRVEAKRRVRRASELAPRRAVTGERLDPQLAETSAAVRAGEISGDHAIEVGRSLDDIPAHLEAEATTICERALVEAARHMDPLALRRFGRQLVERLDPDGPRPKDVQRQRGFTLLPTGDGGSVARGRLDALCTALLQTVLDALATPRPVVNADGVTVPDERSAAQRRHDALAEAARRLLRSGTLPDTGGVPVSLLVTSTASELARTGGVVRTAHGELITADDILALAGELGVDLTVLDDADPDDTDPVRDDTGRDRATQQALDSDVAARGLLRQRCDDEQVAPPRWLRRLIAKRRPGCGPVLAFGRIRRTATVPQRKVMAARDGAGCCFPGCTRPLAWTQAHHVVRWEDGGPTDVANMCLVCTYHHRLLDHGDWQVVMAADGHPVWIPPPWVDVRRRPMRNTAHHLPEIDFRPLLVKLD